MEIAKTILGPQKRESNLPKSQCGLFPGPNIIDMIFTVRQIKEKCLEQNLVLLVVFIDLTITFEIVNRRPSGQC